jgi:hypothetical protein
MKRDNAKNTAKEILVIAFFWLMAAAVVYMAYLKIKTL